MRIEQIADLARERKRQVLEFLPASARRQFDLNAARRTLLKSDALSPDEKQLLRKVSLRTHANDDMYVDGGGRHYLSVGLSAIRCINEALDHARRDRPIRSLLDLPSGYGRILRFLKVRFPDAQVSCCELMPEAAEFCREEFQVRGTIADLDFGKIRLIAAFDLIWCGSLLTHLDEAHTIEAMRMLHDHLAPGGICLFTIHGELSVSWLRSGAETYGLTRDAKQKALSEFDETGYGYADYEGFAGYGISISSHRRVLELASQMSDWKLASLSERGWGNHHDVYAFARGTDVRPKFMPAHELPSEASHFFRWEI